jgi:hypothetical protein
MSSLNRGEFQRVPKRRKSNLVKYRQRNHAAASLRRPEEGEVRVAHQSILLPERSVDQNPSRAIRRIFLRRR